MVHACARAQARRTALATTRGRIKSTRYRPPPVGSRPWPLHVPSELNRARLCSRAGPTAQAHGRGGYVRVRPAGRRARSCSENESSRPAAGRRRRRWPRRARPRPKSSEKQRFQVAAAQGARGQCSPKPQRPAWWRTVRHEKGAGCRLSDEMKPGACMRCFRPGRARSDRSAPAGRRCPCLSPNRLLLL